MQIAKALLVISPRRSDLGELEQSVHMFHKFFALTFHDFTAGLGDIVESEAGDEGTIAISHVNFLSDSVSI